MMLCAKYEEAGLCDSCKKCDRNYCDASDDDNNAKRWITIPVCRLMEMKATQLPN